VIINVLISAGFMFLVFGRAASINLWGPHGLALDFVPQTFMITLMSIVVPTLLTRKRLVRGQSRPLSGTHRASSIQPDITMTNRFSRVCRTVALGTPALTALNAAFVLPAAPSKSNDGLAGIWQSTPIEYGQIATSTRAGLLQRPLNQRFE